MDYRILVVDDDVLTRAWLTHVLQQQGFKVFTAETGARGLALAVAERPHLMLLDWVLPDIEGLDVCKQLRADPQTADMRIIMLTIRDSVEDIQRGLEAGADDYILKRPGVDRELIAKVRALSRRGPSPLVRPQGDLIAFMGTRGGAGTTSICLNMAHVLNAEPDTELVVVDVARPLGRVERMTALRGGSPLSELLAQSDAITQDRIHPYLRTSKRWGFRAVLGNREPLSGDLPIARLQEALTILRDAFSYVFIDVGQPSSESHVAILQASQIIVLVLAGDADSIAGGRIYLDQLERKEFPHDRLYPILNMPFGRGGIGRQEMESQLDINVVGTIPYTEEVFGNATNRSLPFVDIYPNHSTSIMFRNLTHQLREWL